MVCASLARHYAGRRVKATEQRSHVGIVSGAPMKSVI
jgi:hypothetical protein